MARQVALDGVRGTAILLVLLFHLHAMRGGYLGVDVFFVLSGFLITGLLLREVETTGSIDFARFFRHRARRLLPPLLICIAMALAIAWYKNTLAAAATDVIATLSYTSNYQRGSFPYLWHTWSLAVEAQFYLIWPLVIFFGCRLARQTIYRSMIVLMLAVLLWRLYLLRHGGDWAIDRTYEGLDTRCDALLAGAFAAILVRERRWPASRAAVSTAAIIIALAVLLVRPGKIWMNGLGFSIIAVCAAYVIGYVSCLKQSSLSRLFCLPPLVFFGDISYGLYLYHFPIMQFFHDDLGFAAPFGAVLSILVAVLSWFSIERPLVRRKVDRRRTLAVQGERPVPR